MKQFLLSYLLVSSSLVAHTSAFYCVDSPFKLVVENARRDCENAERLYGCENPEVASHCPVTCDTCDEYRCEDSLAPVVYGDTSPGEEDFDPTNIRTCEFFAGLPLQHIYEKCQVLPIAKTCRATCGWCVKEPSASPSSVPTTTTAPSSEPTSVPSVSPTSEPTSVPSVSPTSEPTSMPSATPTIPPTMSPTMLPTMSPTMLPTMEPTSGIPPVVTLGSNLDQWDFNPTGEAFCFDLSASEFDVGSAYITVNGSGSSGFTTTNPSGQICTTSKFTGSGENAVVLTATTIGGVPVSFTGTIWCGTFVVTVYLRDDGDNPYPGLATCTAISADDTNIEGVQTTTTGTCVFYNLPARTIIFEGSASNGDFGATGVVLFGGTSVTVFMFGFEDPSDIDNNDFSLGLQGWEVGGTDAIIIDNEINDGLNKDLRLTTGGTEGLKRVSRTFVIVPPSNLSGVYVRYKFITSEVPGGWFGSQYNDYFFVMIRAQVSGDSVAEVNSMNSLGLDAFDANGATDWRYTQLDFADAGDIVQVDCGVANVGDGWLDSEIIIDFVAYTDDN